MEFQEAMERARTAAYEPDAAVDWDLVEVAGRECADQMEAGPLGEYMGHHLPRWDYPVRIEGAHPWAKLEARILAQPVLPIPTAERNDADSMRSACVAWRAMLGALDTQDEEARWRGWLCAWVLGWEDWRDLLGFCKRTVEFRGLDLEIRGSRINSIYFRGENIAFVNTIHTLNQKPHWLWGGSSEALFCGGKPLPFNTNPPMTPETVAQAAQQCFIRIPDRIVARFGLRRWQTSLGFEV